MGEDDKDYLVCGACSSCHPSQSLQAKEVLDGEPNINGFLADQHSLGVILLWMVTGEMPTRYQVRMKIWNKYLDESLLARQVRDMLEVSVVNAEIRSLYTCWLQAPHCLAEVLQSTKATFFLQRDNIRRFFIRIHVALSSRINRT